MSQADRILAILLDGQSHSSAELIERAYGVDRPYSISFTRRISDLRERGHIIRKEPIKGSKGYAYRLIVPEQMKMI